MIWEYFVVCRCLLSHCLRSGRWKRSVGEFHSSFILAKTMAVDNDLAVVIDQHKQSIQYGLYSTALLGLAIALRSVRPFKRFTSAESVPSSFIKKHVTLHGRVISVESSGVLMVDHFPIWSLPRRSSSLLPICIDSIQPMGLSTSWLQTVVQGEKIKFQPVTVEGEALSCIILRGKKNVGIQLVSLGFACVKPIHIVNQEGKLYSSYYKGLLDAEDKAEREGRGIWAEGRKSGTLWSRLKLRSLYP